MKTKAPKIFILSNGKEVHFPAGNYSAAVCWNVKKIEKKLKGPDNLIYRAEAWERESKPYVDFITIREYQKDVFVEDEDSPVDGGLSVEAAKKLSEELSRAVEYCKTVARKSH